MVGIYSVLPIALKLLISIKGQLSSCYPDPLSNGNSTESFWKLKRVSRIGVKARNVKKQNVKKQNVKKQNVKKQNVKKQNVKKTKCQKTKCRKN
jgi:hypothetical protein